MKVSVQTDNITSLREGTKSRCDSIRFGAEFCVYKMPNRIEIEKAYEIVHSKGKKFTYVIPRLSNAGVEKLLKQSILFDKKKDFSIVINDLGALNILGQYKNVELHLGRQLIRVPARSPWVEVYLKAEDLEPNDRLTEVFSFSSINYLPTLKFLRDLNVKHIDVDWIPRIFPSFNQLIENGYELSLHPYLVPIAVARRCHTARLIGEKKLEECSKPCKIAKLLLKNEPYQLELYLQGNTVFQFTSPNAEAMRELNEKGVSEIVLEMNQFNHIDSREKIDSFIDSIE